jgi:F0F1-type ATP synthase delta subunit
METAYARALWNLIANGMKHADAVKAIALSLEAKGRGALMGKVARAFERIASRETMRSQTVLFVAKEADAKKAMLESKVADADVVVDSSLIGGWRLMTADTLVDASWKKHLLSMYNRIAH